MPHFYHGTSEANLLIQSSPGMVSYWLAKARQDRRNWSIRLFQPEKRRFLDGFIAGLEEHVKGVELRDPAERTAPEPVEQLETVPEVAEPPRLDVDPRPAELP